MRVDTYATPHPSRVRTRACPDVSARFRGDGGATLMEMAIIFPVLLIFVFLVIEGALLFSNWQGINNGLLAASRTATIYGNDSMADYQTLLAWKRDSVAVRPDQLLGFAIFKPSPNSAFGTMNAGCKTGSVAGVCNFYDKTDISLIPSTPPTLYFSGCTDSSGTSGTKKDRFWCPVNRKVAVQGTNGPPDYIGLWVKVRHQAPTKMFGSFRDLEQTIIIKLEPQELQ